MRFIKFFIFIFVLFACILPAGAFGAISFSSLVYLDLTGLNSNTLWVNEDSIADFVNISGSVLDVSNVNDAQTFSLGTSDYATALSITPAGGNATLQIDSSYIDSGEFSQWVLNTESNVAHTVGLSLANTWYAIKIDDVNFNSFQTDDSGELDFILTDLTSTSTITLSKDETSPTEFGLASPVNRYNTSNGNMTFSWNAVTDTDISYYQLYIDDLLEEDFIFATDIDVSVTCGIHTWYIRAIDQAGNYTNSDQYNFTINCSSGFIIPSIPVTTSIKNTAFYINNNDLHTSSPIVELSFFIDNVKEIAISNNLDFINSSFVTYNDSAKWILSEGGGTKIVYVKFRSQDGGTVVFSDSIILTDQSIDYESEYGVSICDLTKGQAYKISQSPSVYYITENCTKRAFKRSDVFFTYFDSWDDVKTTTQTKLDSIANDTLGFMPYGPKYDPKYGALVKTVTDPKVYLLLGTEKYWITSEDVFTTLNYAWNWIEDVSTGLLDKYTNGSEIIYTDHHPNHTLIKYENSNKVYKLEDNKKRHIVDEAAFNTLGYRWDRIVIVPDSEVYEDGADLTAEEQ